MAEHDSVREAAEQFHTKARRTTRVATLLVILPFALALGLGLQMRHDAEQEAVTDLVNTVQALARHLADGKVAAHQAIEQVVEERHGPKCTTLACDRLRQLSRMLVVRLPAETFARADDPQAVRAVLDPLIYALVDDVWISHAVYGVLVMLIGLLMVGQIRRTLTIYEANRGSRTFDEHVRFISAYLKLQEAGRLRAFWTRLGFATVIALGFLYVIRPMGLRAAVLLDLTQQLQHATEGSAPFWLTGMVGAAPVAFGIAGFMLYAFVLCTRRFASGQLTDQTLSSLITRAVVVLLTGLVLAGVYPDSTTAGAMVFLAGIFPRRGIDLISKLAESSASKLSTGDEGAFARMPTLTIWDQMALKEQGINSIGELAHAGVDELLARASIQGRLVLDAVDRAILLHAFDDAQVAGLAKLPISRASRLVEYLGDDERSAERKAQVEGLMGLVDLGPILEQLVHDENIQRIIALRGMGQPAPAAPQA